MTPRKITDWALIVASISVLGIIITLFFRPDGGLLNWWPAVGLGLSFLFTIIALARGASIAAQKQIDMLDMMNDCNAGVLDPDNP